LYIRGDTSGTSAAIQGPAPTQGAASRAAAPRGGGWRGNSDRSSEGGGEETASLGQGTRIRGDAGHEECHVSAPADMRIRDTPCDPHRVTPAPVAGRPGRPHRPTSPAAEPRKRDTSVMRSVTYPHTMGASSTSAATRGAATTQGETKGRPRRFDSLRSAL
jgi:hypothetical protein